MEEHKLGIATISLGWHPTHTLEDKLTAAAKYGFVGVEMVCSDLKAYAKRHSMSMVEAGRAAGALCDNLKLEIICLGSFDNFEGSKIPLSERLKSAEEWIDIAHALETDMIQIPANFLKDCDGTEDTIVNELRQLADLGAKSSPPIRFGYEALGWSIHVADWEESLRIVELVDRSNFGLCFDTYHILARVWADVSAENGMRPGGTTALNASIKRFLDDCPADRIFYIQLSDAERCQPPLRQGHPAYSPDRDPTHSWNNWGRLFPGETKEGAYLPMIEICRAMLKQKGWRGFVSMEIFHRTMEDESKVPEYWAKRGRASWDGLCSSLTT